MLLVFLLAVQYSALGVYSRNARRSDTEMCFDEVDHINCTNVLGRPSKCDCEEETECYIHLEITRQPNHEPGEPEEFEYFVNNEQGQGPTIIAKFNIIVVVDVFNNMNETTSIHWHGMHQVSFPWFDGVGAVTQYAIKPFGKFRYIFRAFPQGTHWYHSHTGLQREAGLLGALIILDDEDQSPNGTIIDTPENHAIILQEQETLSSATKGKKVRYCLPDGSEVPFQFDKISLLMNGKHLAATPSQRTQDEQLEFSVEPGVKHRFRIIAAMSSDIYAISIENHTMDVIATDGFLVRAFTTDYLVLHISERYDFIVTGKDYAEPGERFLIRVQTLAARCDSPGDIAGRGYAYLVYRPSHKFKPQIGRKHHVRQDTETSEYTVLNCPMKNFPDDYFGNGTTTICHDTTSLQLLYPTDDEHLPSNNPTTEAFFDFLRINEGALINGVKFEDPSTPLVTNWKNETEDCRYPLECDTPAEEQCTHAIYFGGNQETVRFVFSALGGEGHDAYNTHPIHMHGHSYFVAKVGYPEYDENGNIEEINNDLEVPACGPGNWRDNTAPSDISVNSTTVRKDAITVPAGGYVVVDFITDNPGYWLMHCHIDRHLVDGMAIALGENIDCARNAPGEVLDPAATEFCMTLEEFKALEETPVCTALKKKRSKHGKAARKKRPRKFDPDEDFMFQFERIFRDGRKFAGGEE